MSAAEKLRALDARRKRPVGSISPSVRELVDALPQIVALVEAAERSVLLHSLLYSDSTATPEQNAEIYTRAMAVHDSLAALDEKLS